MEKATRAELAGMPEPVRTSAVARAAVEMARRLDNDPADSVAVLVARELRQCMAALHGQAKGDSTSDIDEYLRQVSAAAFDAGH